MAQITKNFTWEEMYKSQTAASRGIDNTPDMAAKANLLHLATMILQKVRDKYGKPIIVTSGYRCPALNKAVGGAKTSQHMYGQAVDIKASQTANKALFDLIKTMIDNKEITVGQLIWEYGTKKEPNWIHISLPRENKQNNQILYLYS